MRTAKIFIKATQGTMARRRTCSGLIMLGLVLLLGAPLLAQGNGKGGGKNKASLSLAVNPESFLESDAGATGTVTRANSDTSATLTVTLKSNDTNEATVPSSVQIVAGASSAEFFITAVDDTEIDGDQLVTISASAPDHSGASAQITVVDDDGDGTPPPSTRRVIAYQKVVISPPDGGVLNVNGANNLGDIGGFVYPDAAFPEHRRGYIYNALTNAFTDANSIVDPTAIPDGYVIGSVVCINDNGTFGGYLISVDALGIVSTLPYVASIDTRDLEVLPTDEQTGVTNSVLNINNRGDAVVQDLGADGVQDFYVFNPGFDAVFEGGGTRDSEPDYLPSGFSIRVSEEYQPTSPSDGSAAKMLVAPGPAIYTKGSGVTPVTSAGGYEVVELLAINDSGTTLAKVVTGYSNKGKNAIPFTEIAEFDSQTFSIIPGTTSDYSDVVLQPHYGALQNNDNDLIIRESRLLNGVWEHTPLIRRTIAPGTTEFVELGADLENTWIRNISDRFMGTGYPMISGEVGGVPGGLMVLLPPLPSMP